MATVKKETTTKEKVSKVPSVPKGKTEKVEAVASVKPLDTRGTSGTRGTSLSVTMFSLLGKEAGTLALPKDLFGAEVNKALLAQALRVYLNNQKGHFSNTKTRGQVEGSTRKIYNQKGTGRARHGGIRAPIFVGGGIALGPKSRTVTLELPKKMKKASLIAALSQKLLDKGIYAISGLEKSTGKTSEMAKFIKAAQFKSAVIVTDKISDSTHRATSNLKNINVLPASDLNAFDVISAHSLIFTKEAVEVLEKRMTPKAETTETKEDKKISN